VVFHISIATTFAANYKNVMKVIVAAIATCVENEREQSTRHSRTWHPKTATWTDVHVERATARSSIPFAFPRNLEEKFCVLEFLTYKTTCASEMLEKTTSEKFVKKDPLRVAAHLARRHVARAA
jgi:hypothetical protein